MKVFEFTGPGWESPTAFFACEADTEEAARELLHEQLSSIVAAALPESLFYQRKEETDKWYNNFVLKEKARLIWFDPGMWD